MRNTQSKPIITQEQSDAALIKMMKGQRAEIFATIDPETARVQVLYECNNHMAACLMLSQIIESFARKGMKHDLIRQTVELGLYCSKKRK